MPPLAVSVSPGIVVLPLRSPARTVRAGAAARARELRVTVTNGRPGPATAAVRLRVPSGWRVTPSHAALRFTREDESAAVRFTVVAPLRAPAGESVITAIASDAATGGEGGAAGDPAWSEGGYELVDDPRIQRRHVPVPSTTRLLLLDVALAPALHIGYVGAADDPVPLALQQLGARVTIIGPDDLAWGSLSKYDAILTAVHAYERRQDLRANNDRLLRYVQDGGTLIVQNNAHGDPGYGPYPARVGAGRVTDETAPVTVLAPAHPVFNYPNRIDGASWKDWVEERGRDFLGERAPEYVDLVQTADPFEYNKGAKTGALVEARYGKGRWIYVGLGLSRQLSAGTPGAYALLANIASLGKAPPLPRTR